MGCGGAVLFLKLSLLHVSVFEQNSFGFLCLNNTLLVSGPLTWGPCCVSVRDPFDPSLSYLVFAFYALPPCFIADCPIQLICICVFAYLYFYLYVDPLSVIFSFCLLCVFCVAGWECDNFSRVFAFQNRLVCFQLEWSKAQTVWIV